MEPIDIKLPEEPGDALAAVVALRLLADQLERKAVRRAVQEGWTWAQIAEGLGVTRQAAHKKHAAMVAAGPPALQRHGTTELKEK